MRILEGLGEYEAVKMEERYVVGLQPYVNGFYGNGYYGNVYYEVAGVRVKNTSQVVVDNLEDILKVVPPKTTVESYSNEDQTISVDEWRSLRQDLNNRLDEDGDALAMSVEEEVEFVRVRAHFNSFKPNRKIGDEVLQPVDIVLIGSHEDTGSDFIETPFKHGLAKFSGTSGIYKVKLSAIARDEFEAYRRDNPDVDLKNSSHSNIRFCTIGGKYIFTQTEKSWVEKTGQTSIGTSLSEAKELEGGVRKYIRDILDLHCKPQKASEATILDLVDTLQATLRDVQSLDVKQKSRIAKGGVIKRLNERIVKFGG